MMMWMTAKTMKRTMKAMIIAVKHVGTVTGERQPQPLYPTTNGEVCSLRQTGRGQRNTSVLAMQNDSLLLACLSVTWLATSQNCVQTYWCWCWCLWWWVAALFLLEFCLGCCCCCCGCFVVVVVGELLFCLFLCIEVLETAKWNHVDRFMKVKS